MCVYVCVLTAERKVSFNSEGVPESVSSVRRAREPNLGFLPDSGARWTHHHPTAQPANVPGQTDHWEKNTLLDCEEYCVVKK